MSARIKKEVKALVTLVTIGLSFFSCAQLTQNHTPAGRLIVTANWVQSSLAQKNDGFRKVNRMSPVLYKNWVIVGNALDGIVAFNQENGQEVWRLPIPQGVEASAAVVKDFLFVGSNNGRMYSIDLSKGQIIWMFDTKSEVVSEPLLNDGVLYFISGSQSIFALEAVTGKQLWTYNRQDTANLMTVRGGSKPAISNGVLYAGFSDGSLVSLNAKTGTQQSEITLNKNTRFKDIDASPVIDGDNIYINSYDDKMYCVSKIRGEILWSTKTGGVSTPLLYGDKLIYTSTRGDLIAVSKMDGHEIWKLTTSDGILTDPILYDGFIVTGESSGSLLLIDSLTGKSKGSFEPGRGLFSRPTANADTKSIYFISGEGNAYSVRAEISRKATISFLRQ